MGQHSSSDSSSLSVSNVFSFGNTNTYGELGHFPYSKEDINSNEGETVDYETLHQVKCKYT